MGEAWFTDLRYAIIAFASKRPNNFLFNEIRTTNNCDFIIISNREVYLVKHEDFSVWRQVTIDVWERL